MTSSRAHCEVGRPLCGARARRQSRLSPLRRAGAALKAANGAHGAELAELSGLLHAGLVKREPEDLSRKVVDEPEHALKPPRHKVRHTSARRRRARTHSHTYCTGHSCIIYRACRTMRRAPCSRRTSRARPRPDRPAVLPAQCIADLGDYQGPLHSFGITHIDIRERDTTIDRH